MLKNISDTYYNRKYGVTNYTGNDCTMWAYVKGLEDRISNAENWVRICNALDNHDKAQLWQDLADSLYTKLINTVS